MLSPPSGCEHRPAGALHAVHVTLGTCDTNHLDPIGDGAKEECWSLRAFLCLFVAVTESGFQFAS
jgi:hypothetical protein